MNYEFCVRYISGTRAAKMFPEIGFQIRILFCLMNFLTFSSFHRTWLYECNESKVKQARRYMERRRDETDFFGYGRSGITGFCCRHRIISQWHPRLSQLCQPSCMICMIHSWRIRTIRCHHHRCRSHPIRSFCSRVGR